VKPDNFLFLTEAADSPLKLIDFGLAERFDKNRLIEAVGTPYYVAPEVLQMMDGII
jgi:calcium-dependent protein kinase